MFQTVNRAASNMQATGDVEESFGVDVRASVNPELQNLTEPREE
jgi:hypothetical protein